MTAEKGPQANPIDAARAAFQEEMVATTYDTQTIAQKLLGLQIVLLEQGTPRPEVFRELIAATSRAVSQAVSKKDERGSEQFNLMRRGYELTLRTYTEPEKAKRAEPTPTAQKEMSQAKA